VLFPFVKQFSIGFFDRNRQWLNKNPKYEFKTTNCQKFAHDLIMWLTDGAAVIPAVQAANIDIESGPAAMAVAANGETKVHD
jgi:hypothetical protein